MFMERYNKLTEQVSQKTKDLDMHTIRDIIEIMNGEDETVAKAVQYSLPQIETAIENIVDVMKAGGRLFYIGAGTSGRIGVLDASECPPTFGVDSKLVTGIIAGGETALYTSVENVEDDENAGKQDVIKKVTSQDAVIGLAASGTTPYVLGATKAARDIGALTSGISCNQNTLLSQTVRNPIEVLVGPEILTGSTRLKAGTAQKMVLNMISTTVMIKLGKVYGNLMVNMQASNDKLRKRAIEIVAYATGEDYKTAKNTINKANGDVRASILMIQYSVDYQEAINALHSTKGHFRNAMNVIEQRYLN